MNLFGSAMTARMIFLWEDEWPLWKHDDCTSDFLGGDRSDLFGGTMTVFTDSNNVFWGARMTFLWEREWPVLEARWLFFGQDDCSFSEALVTFLGKHERLFCWNSGGLFWKRDDCTNDLFGVTGMALWGAL